jgi:hypothetical protein
MKRWSYIAYSCIACLVVTGEFQASRQVDPVQALWSTGYGAVLLIKLGVIGAMLVAAVLAQRRVLAPAAREPGGTADERFAGGDVLTVIRSSVRIEAALAVVVLAVTAVLVSEPPATTTYGPMVDMDAPLGTDVVHVHIDDTRRGRQDVELDVTDAAGRPVPVQAITANLSTASVAALGVRLVSDPGDTSRWHSTNAVVPLPGIWTLTLDVTVDQTEAYATAARYRVWQPERAGPVSSGQRLVDRPPRLVRSSRGITMTLVDDAAQSGHRGRVVDSAAWAVSGGGPSTSSADHRVFLHVTRRARVHFCGAPPWSRPCRSPAGEPTHEAQGRCDRCESVRVSRARTSE